MPPCDWNPPRTHAASTARGHARDEQHDSVHVFGRAAEQKRRIPHGLLEGVECGLGANCAILGAKGEKRSEESIARVLPNCRVVRVPAPGRRRYAV